MFGGGLRVIHIVAARSTTGDGEPGGGILIQRAPTGPIVSEPVARNRRPTVQPARGQARAAARVLDSGLRRARGGARVGDVLAPARAGDVDADGGGRGSRPSA